MERDSKTKEKMYQKEYDDPEDFRLKRGVDRFIIGFKSKPNDNKRK